MTLPQSFPLTGMTCTSCAAKVTARLLEHPDIATAEVGLSPPLARITTRAALSNEAVDEWLRPLGKYHVPLDSAAPASTAATPLPAKSAQTYRPLIVLLAYLLVTTAVTAESFDVMGAMNLFMGGFFVAFSFFKMLDLRGFADAYRSYDLVAKAVPAYGYVYPFIELALGLGYLSRMHEIMPAVNTATAVVMAVSLAGVLRAVLSKQAIRCACLGTVFNLPMSTVTIIEDGLMLAMALASLFLV
jgi:copper chaperone CopZ